MRIIKNFKSVFKLLAVLALVPVSLSSCGKKYPGMNITFMDFGKADAILITTENHTVIVDAANKGDGKTIYEHCSEMDRTSIDYFIVTHFDKDHVGGGKAVTEKFDRVENIIYPDYEESSSEYSKFMTAVKEKGITPQIPKEPVSFTLDDAVFTVYPPLEDSYTEVNNYSLAVTVEYGENSIILAGDAEKTRIKELLKQVPENKDGYDLIKMPHHGKAEKNTDKLIEYFRPSAAVITCSEKEPADDETLEILTENGTEIFTTGNGDISFFCDGKNVKHSE